LGHEIDNGIHIAIKGLITRSLTFRSVLDDMNQLDAESSDDTIQGVRCSQTVISPTKDQEEPPHINKSAKFFGIDRSESLMCTFHAESFVKGQQAYISKTGAAC
jgi:hypothetical protein